ncbi:DMT family transporter [Peterkaempfera griseoplana]|uniref:DMT family transporter n=1 Tax=Peterkaempfera griseoplana TaxID=66896 RepID=UPI0006E45D53|nr:DMT family transporter [Peterkaempfera griseoplana]
MAHTRTTLPVGRGLLYATVAAAAWGTAGAAATALHHISGLGPLAVSFWRFALGALLLLAARPLLGLGRWTARRVLRPRQLLVGLCMAVFQTAYLAAVDQAGLAVGTAVTMGTVPVFTAVGARLVLGERLGRAGSGTVALAVAGLLLLALGSAGGTGTGGSPLLGFVCALVSAAGCAFVNLLGQHGRGSGAEPYDAALAGFVVGAVLLLPACRGGDLLPGGGHLERSLLLLGYLGAVPSALAYGLFFAAATVVRATTVSVLMMLEPLAALLLAVSAFGERLTPAAAAGTALLLAGVVVLARAERTGPVSAPQ